MPAALVFVFHWAPRTSIENGYVLAVYWVAVLNNLKQPVMHGSQKDHAPAFGASKIAGGCPGKHGGAGFLSQSCINETVVHNDRLFSEPFATGLFL